MGNNFKTGCLFNFKDRLLKGMWSSLVNKYCWAHWQSINVGSTVHTLCTRVCQHVGRSFRTDCILCHPPHSAIRDHAFLCNVSVLEEYFTIVRTASNVIDLRILESLHIFKTRPVFNDMQRSFPLNILSR